MELTYILQGCGKTEVMDNIKERLRELRMKFIELSTYYREQILLGKSINQVRALNAQINSIEKQIQALERVSH
jgi:uridine kinase